MKERLISVDVMRGITIAGMLMVNNPGSWSYIYSPLRHASWNGLTPTDLVFPFFMFIMGMSAYFSLKKYDFAISWPTFWKIIRRTVILFAIGIGIAWFGRSLRGLAGGKAFWDAILNFDTIRILGVIPRLAICYGVGTLIAILSGRRVVWVTAIILIVYAIILITGSGFEFSENNVIAIVDRAVLGVNHMYSDTINGETLKFDPEGLLSTIPSIAHVLIGFMAGKMVLTSKDNDSRVIKLMVMGTCLTFAGFLLSYGIPINKKIWSPTFVLTTCGLASLLLGLLIWIIDIHGWKKWTPFFRDFGVNPLFLYVLGTIFSILLGVIKVGERSLHGYIYKDCLVPLCDDNVTLASLLFALLFVGFNWIFAYILYRNKIYIKI